MRVTADVSDVVRYGRQLGEAAYRRAIVGLKRELEAGASELADESIEILQRIQTSPHTSDGLAAQGIVWEEATVQPGGVLECLVGWLRKYGVILEHGPHSMSSWIIRAKRSSALRWWGAEGKTAGNVAGQVFYAKWVEHTWDPSHKRPHMEPAAKKLVPRISRRILKATGSAFRRVR